MHQNIFLITKYRHGVLSMLLHQNRVEDIHFYSDEKDNISVGNIYVGRVSNVVKNMNAAFVEISPGVQCFLPFDKCMAPYLGNREFDGKLIIGDELLIQIEKEPSKTKDALGTTNLSLSGKYCVLSSGNKKVGYSNKLSPGEKSIIKDFLLHDCPGLKIQEKAGSLKTNGNYGIVVRTNVKSLIPDRMEYLEQELMILKEQLEDIIKKGSTRTCYTKLVQAPPSYISSLKGLYGTNYDKIVTDDPLLFQICKEYLNSYDKENENKLSFYEDERISLSSLYGLESKVSELLQKKVWLKSGGYLIIEPTEALVVIDVNSGKYSGKQDKEEAIFRINMEAAEEIIHQVRLRNLSGILIIDFINMRETKNNELLVQKIKSMVRTDSIRTEFIDITPLGLIELTRKKMEKTLEEQFA